MKKLFLLLIFVGLQLRAQTYKLAGNVKDENAKTLSNISVIIDNNKHVQTDAKGFFEINLPQGKHNLTINELGYKIYKTNISLNRNLYLDIQLKKNDISLDEVKIYAINATKDMPVTHTNIKKENIEEQNLGQDIPYLLDFTPSVVTTSDAGAGVGYTGIRIRGISPQQINVTLNGVPLNDPESHGVYWVDIPDFASSTQNIQIQRGVGTSTFGTGAFGASISLTTDGFSDKPYAQIQTSYGSFNTQKISAKASTGLLKNHFEFTGRVSKIKSDGYIDRASSNMKSYYLSGAYKDDKNILKAIVFGGTEKTYQAWYGVDKDKYDNNPTFNYAGAIYNDVWEIARFYDNEIDNYKQDHYQLHYERTLADNIKFNLTGHYTYGRGYYEQYKQDKDFSDYGFTPMVINGQNIDKTDLIRRKWLDNDFYGLTASLAYQTSQMQIILGFAGNEYDGRHFGRVIWARFASDSEIRHEYYRNTGIKKNFGGFAKSIYKLTDKLKLYTDVQFRKIDYKINGTLDYNANFKTQDNLFFVNPKIGLFYDINNRHQAYFSLAQTHREPNRDDYINNPTDLPKPETLNDMEFGWKFKQNRLQSEINLFGMFYKNQLVLTGNIDNVGNPIRKNVGESYRIGIETQIAYAINHKFQLDGNVTLSQNRNKNYYEVEGGNLKNYGDTKLPYSPQIIAGGSLIYKPIKGLKLQLFSKYVGEQYMDNRNIEASKLEAYFTENALLSYQIKGKNFFDNMRLQLKINNIFSKKYASNGYMWGDTPYYFPQAGRNYLLGLSIKF